MNDVRHVAAACEVEDEAIFLVGVGSEASAYHLDNGAFGCGVATDDYAVDVREVGSLCEGDVVDEC